MAPTDAQIAFATWVAKLDPHEYPLVTLPNLPGTRLWSPEPEEDDETLDERLATLARIRPPVGGS